MTNLRDHNDDSPFMALTGIMGCAYIMWTTLIVAVFPIVLYILGIIHDWITFVGYYVIVWIAGMALKGLFYILLED